MPTQAQRSQSALARELFRKEYAHRVHDPREVRDEFMRRSGIPVGKWYALVSEFRGMIAKSKADGEHGKVIVDEPAQQNHAPASDERSMSVIDEPPQLIIPSNLDDAGKKAFNHLLSMHDHLVTENQVKTSEINLLRSSLAAVSKKNQFLKKFAAEAIEAF